MNGANIGYWELVSLPGQDAAVVSECLGYENWEILLQVSWWKYGVTVTLFPQAKGFGFSRKFFSV